MIGYAFCGSFCTFKSSLKALESLAKKHDIIPIFSENFQSTNSRFGNAKELTEAAEAVCKKSGIYSIKEAEKFGPAMPLDALIISPCTGNTLAKLANGITDTSVTMAAKAHLRNCRPLILAIASNDALSANLKNIGELICRKNIYFVPFSQDAPFDKPSSLVCNFSLIENTLECAAEGKQIQPVLI